MVATRYDVMVYALSGHQHTGVESTYQGDNWVKALGVYHKAVASGQHVVLWEGENPVHEFFPNVGHEPGWGNCPHCHAEHPTSQLTA